MAQFNQRHSQESGFTLIELSIALVIIGLIVGGVLVGRDLIKAAQMRALASQVTQIEAAMSTFRNKYNCLAGDCNNATSFFTSVTNGNGDRKICLIHPYANWGYTACNYSGTNETVSWTYGGAHSETSLVFDHLASAGLISLLPYDEASNVSNMAGVGFPEMQFQGTGTQASTGFGSRGGLVLHYLNVQPPISCPVSTLWQ